MAATGQTINDRLNAVRYALAGQGLARTVCKATTEEVIGPKKKHIDYLLACTHEPNVSIPQLANLLIDRSQHTSWAVVFKSLITIHHLLNYGNERFTQYLATLNHSFELGDFMDRTTPQGYGMSTFVRRYANYINNKINSFRKLGIDLCKVKLGKDNALRTMNMDGLCKALPFVHNQFDSLLDFGAEGKDLNNGIIMAAFKLLYKDLNRIFAAYQEAIINLVERYFKLSRKKTREALNLYKLYLNRMDKVANFFKIVEQAGLDKSEMPDTSKLVSLLSVMEEHMAQLDAKKGGASATSPDPDDHRDESVTPNKGSQQDLTTKNEQPKGQSTDDSSSSQKKPTTPEPPKASSISTANEPPKKALPPARPSPAKLNKGPQVDTSSAQPNATTQEAEKKTPPGRPPKPPSRPPPPSGPAQVVTAASHQQTPSTNQRESGNADSDSTSDDKKQVSDSARDEAEQASNSTHDDKEKIAEENNVSPSTQAPACSSHAQETSQVTQSNSEQTSAPQANGSDTQAEHGNGTTTDVDQRAESTTGGTVDDSPNLPTCSNTVVNTNQETKDEQVNGEAQQENSADTNHVSANNVAHHDGGAPDGEAQHPSTPPPPVNEQE